MLHSISKLTFIPCWALIGLTVQSITLEAIGNELSIVVPNGYEQRPGEGKSDRSYQPNGWRIQNVFDANQFSALPSPGHLMTGFSFRPDEANPEAFSETWSHLTLIVGTTSLGLNELDTVFAENLEHVENPTTAYDGPITFSTQNQFTDTGAKEFDLEFHFQEPVLYNPTEGNPIY